MLNAIDIDLICSLSLETLKTPVRGSHCTH